MKQLPLSRFAGDAHFFAEMLHDFIGDGEAKPRAPAVMRFIDFIETIKHVRQIRRGNADARVGDADADDLILRAGAQRNGSAFRRILDALSSSAMSTCWVRSGLPTTFGKSFGTS